MSNNSNAPDIIQKALTHAIKDLELMGVENDYGRQALQSFEDYIELERHHFTEDQRLYRQSNHRGLSGREHLPQLWWKMVRQQ